MDRDEVRRLEIAVMFSELSAPDMAYKDEWSAGQLFSTQSRHQPCSFVPPEREEWTPPHLRKKKVYVRKFLSEEERRDYLAIVHARLRANPDKWREKLDHQNEWKRTSGARKREWQKLKADPVRHAAELEKQRDRRKRRIANAGR